jgi:hypothetical protein
LLYIREIVFRLSARANGVPPPPKLQKDSGDHPAPYLITPGGERGSSFPVAKWKSCENKYSVLSSTKVKNK